MARQRLEFFSARRVPQFDFLVVASGGERLAVGRNRHGVECVAVAFERPDQFAVVDGPLPYFTEKARFTRGGPHPTYAAVCEERTGHAEVVQLTFDPARISFADVIQVMRGGEGAIPLGEDPLSVHVGQTLLQAEAVLDRELGATTLADLLEKFEEKRARD